MCLEVVGGGAAAALFGVCLLTTRDSIMHVNCSPRHIGLIRHHMSRAPFIASDAHPASFLPFFIPLFCRPVYILNWTPHLAR